MTKISYKIFAFSFFFQSNQSFYSPNTRPLEIKAIYNQEETWPVTFDQPNFKVERPLFDED